MIVIGIDPGLSGAIAIYDTDSRGVDIRDMPVAPTAKGRNDLMAGEVFNILAGVPLTDCWVELVGAMPGQGVSSMFRFGQTVGGIHAAVAIAKHSMRLVTPAVWKRHFGLSKDKGSARGLASQRFPATAHLFARAKDDGRAEAALIALYGAEVSR